MIITKSPGALAEMFTSSDEEEPSPRGSQSGKNATFSRTDPVKMLSLSRIYRIKKEKEVKQKRKQLNLQSDDELSESSSAQAEETYEQKKERLHRE